MDFFLRQRHLPVLLCAAATVASCGGSAEDGSAEDERFVSRCVEHFNNRANDIGRDFVKNSGQKPNYGPVVGGEYEPKVWFGPSRLRPEKCVAVVTLGRDDIIVVLRESFHEGASVGEWAALSGVTEGTLDEQLQRLEESQAVGLPDGRVSLR